ncbi:MAG: hypothetical protein ACU83N_16800 [Gammaproteobacteria bacterium]
MSGNAGNRRQPVLLEQHTQAAHPKTGAQAFKIVGIIDTQQ